MKLTKSDTIYLFACLIFSATNYFYHEYTQACFWQLAMISGMVFKIMDKQD